MRRTVLNTAGAVAFGIASSWLPGGTLRANEADAQVLQALQAAVKRRYAEPYREPIAWTKKAIIETTQLAQRHPSFIQSPVAQPIATVEPLIASPIAQTSAVRAAPPRKVDAPLSVMTPAQVGTVQLETPPAASNTPATMATAEVKPTVASVPPSTQRLPPLNPIRGTHQQVTSPGNPLR